MNARLKTLAWGLPSAAGITAYTYFHDHQMHVILGVAMLAFGVLAIPVWGDAILAWIKPLPRPIRSALQIAGLLFYCAAFAVLNGSIWPAGAIVVAVVAAALWGYDMMLMVRAERRRAQEDAESLGKASSSPQQVRDQPVERLLRHHEGVAEAVTKLALTAEEAHAGPELPLVGEGDAGLVWDSHDRVRPPGSRRGASAAASAARQAR